MKFVAVTAILCVALAAVASAQVGEIHRQTIAYGPAGITTGYSNQACYNTACAYHRQATGRYGYSAGKSATTAEAAPGVYERDATVTGPHGVSAIRSSTITVHR